MLRIWPALFVPPLVFLTLLSLNYALEPPACENQTRLAMHLSAAASLAVAVGCIALAVRVWRSVGGGLPDDKAGHESRTRFLAAGATLLASLSTLSILMLWVVQMLIPPCVR
ncbi:MAG TPA: hypothetical protein VED01_25735 [Burkholderiales bacterium]|nr:hypothetical protein [Burkholderiales bacterium]